jgi:hypothetical protein
LNRLQRIKDGNEEANETDKAKIDIYLEMDADQTHLYLKDKLFIETGEDVEDIFLAFKFYKIL